MNINQLSERDMKTIFKYHTTDRTTFDFIDFQKEYDLVSINILIEILSNLTSLEIQ